MELSEGDFRATECNWIQYSKEHRNHLPPGSITDFKWKDYCPAVFRLLLELENIDHEDYMMSVCSDEIMSKVSIGRPGSMFLMAKDDRFVIRIVRKSEVQVCIEMLPRYYSHVKKFRNTVLDRLYGLHVIKPLGGVKVYFVISSNVFQSDLLMHKCYDLKGSLEGRTVNKLKMREKTILKDLDLDFCFYVDPLIREQLITQIGHDCEFLEASGIMDYSLLLGFHVKGSYQGFYDCRSLFSTDSLYQDSIDSTSSIKKKFYSDLSSRRSFISLGSIASRCSSIRKKSSESLHGNDKVQLTLSDLLLENDGPGSKFGNKMLARAVQIPRKEGSVSSNQTYRSRTCYQVLLYFAIVDIFQDYNVKKRLEHAYKSLHCNSKMIAAVNPKVYSSRFQDFIREIFKVDTCSDELN